MEKLAYDEDINFCLFDTTDKNQREISFVAIDKILTDMKIKYVDMVNDEFK